MDILKTMTTKIYLTHGDIFQLCKELTDNLADTQNIKGLVCILNGGLIPSYYIRKLFKLRNMEFPFKTIDIQSYDDKNRQGKIKVFDKPDLENEGEGWVFIDEVCDTGQTVEYLRELYPKAVFTALCAKDKGREVIDLYISAHPQNEWIVYPWEVAEK